MCELNNEMHGVNMHYDYTGVNWGNTYKDVSREKYSLEIINLFSY